MRNLSMSKSGSQKTDEHGGTGKAFPARWLPALAASAMIALALGVASATLATSASPITIASGVDAVSYSIPSISLSGTAVPVAAPNGAWLGAIGGTQWINTTGNSSDPNGLDRTTSYGVAFDLPAFSSASITVQVLADNAATVSLNGIQIGQQPQGDVYANFQSVSSFTWSNASDFHVGSNTLTIDNADFGVDSGIDFLATVTYAPPIPVTISFTATDKTYDGTPDATVDSCTPIGVGEDDVTCVSSGATASFDTKDAGNRTLTGSGFTLTGTDAWKYTITSASGIGTITPAGLDINATTDSRQYNGTTSSSPAPTVSGLFTVGGDTVTGLSQAFASKNVLGAGLSTLSVTGYLVNDGNSGLDYVVTTHTAAGTITKAPITVTATSNTKTADGTTSAVGTPTVTAGTVFSADNTTGSFTETYGDSLAGFPKTLTPAGVVNDGNGGLDYQYTYVADTTGRIRPAAVASLTFTAQPIDTKTATPIYDTCVPGGNPCAASSAPVKVTARDQYLNLAGPGAPGADITTAAIFIVIHKDNLAGTTVGPAAGTQTSNGVASFGATLTIPGTFVGTTSLFAIPASGPSPSTTSSSFQIVNDLQACTGLACTNLALTSPQSTFGRVTPGGSTLDGVTLTTQYLPTNLAKCIGQGTQVGATTDVKVQGFGVSSARPKFTVALIIPKATLQASHITSRSAWSFNVCLGTTWDGGGEKPPVNSTVPVWRQKQISRNVPLLAQPDTAPSPDVYWGWLPDCSRYLPSTNPCITERTKEANDLRQALGLSKTQFAALGFHDGDLGIVWTTQTPWDGKGSIF